MLDDGESQPGAAELAGAGGIDPVEALGETRQVSGSNAVALVRDRDREIAAAGSTAAAGRLNRIRAALLLLMASPDYLIQK